MKTALMMKMDWWLTKDIKCETIAEPETNDLMITLERTLYFGTCPAYKVTIYGNGTVIYEGKDHVRIKGLQTSTLSKEKMRELLSEFEKVNYFSLKDSYEQHHITDFPSAIT